MNDWINALHQSPLTSTECLVKFKDGIITGAHYDKIHDSFDPIYVEIGDAIVNVGKYDCRNYRDDPQEDVDMNDKFEIVFSHKPTHWKLNTEETS